MLFKANHKQVKSVQHMFIKYNVLLYLIKQLITNQNMESKEDNLQLSSTQIFR